MKFLKLLLVVGILVALIALGWRLIFGGGDGAEISSDQTSNTELYNQKASSIAEICNVLRSGWDVNRFQEGLNIISGASELTQNQRNSLRDSLANGSFAVMDSLICSAFRTSYTEPRPTASSSVGPMYAGLEVIADSCPNVRHNPRYQELINDRRVINDIYAFSLRTMIPTSDIIIRLSPEGLVWNLQLANDAQFRQSQHSRRRELIEARRRLPDIYPLNWLNTTLDEDRVNIRLGEGRRRYLEIQRTKLSDYLENLPNDPRLQNNPGLRQRVVSNGLRPLRDNLGEFNTREMRNRVERAAARINNIRDLPPEANHIITN